MAGKLITLPLRVSFRSARLLTRAASGSAGCALSLTGRAIAAVAPAPPTPQATQPPPAETSSSPRPAPSVRAVSSIRTQGPEPRERPEIPEVREPPHVSEEPELVREVAEPGAEEGAGAAVTVAEPWNGYRQMSAKDVIARAKSANRAQLAAVRLYESRHRSRQTVLAAVDRQLKLTVRGAPA
ncbi:MAG TPA: hypothetical protein VMA77_29990 [Solirubrobacteraceae bacterium]|nr:hypothetical protein [Solirubrobacteraceae bacterium]